VTRPTRTRSPWIVAAIAALLPLGVRVSPAASGFEDFDRGARILGIDFYEGDPSAPHPAEEDVRDRTSAGFARWVDAQLSTENDAIAAPPREMRTFLAMRKDALDAVISALEGRRAEQESARVGPPGRHLAFLRLNTMLVAASLVAARDGDEVRARRALEASWSIYSWLSSGPTVLDQITASGVLKLPVGALRKLEEPPVEWLDRLANEDAWNRVLDACEREPAALAAGRSGLDVNALPDSFPNVHVRAVRAVIDALRGVAPCDAGRLTADEVGRPMREEFRTWSAPESERVADVFTEMEIPPLIGILERTGRLAADTELTARILVLRYEKAASRDRRWPAKLDLSDSRACPGDFYEYRTKGDFMSISLQASPPAGTGGLRLPLSFSTHSKAAMRTPAPVRSPAAPAD